MSYNCWAIYWCWAVIQGYQRDAWAQDRDDVLSLRPSAIYCIVSQ